MNESKKNTLFLTREGSNVVVYDSTAQLKKRRDGYWTNENGGHSIQHLDQSKAALIFNVDLPEKDEIVEIGILEISRRKVST